MSYNQKEKIKIEDFDPILETVTHNIQFLYEQNELLKDLDGNALVLGDPSTAVFYPDPLTKPLHDIEMLIHDESTFREMTLHHESTSFQLPIDDGNCIHIIRNGVSIHLHRRLHLFGDEGKDGLLNDWLAEEDPIDVKIGKYTIPVPQYWLIGLLQLALINRDIESKRIEKSRITDWLMFVKAYLSEEEWPAFKQKTDQLGLTETAKSISRFGYASVAWCSDAGDDLKWLNVIEETETNTLEENQISSAIKRVFWQGYEWVKKSRLRSLFYHINDFSFVLTHIFQGRPKIQPEEKENVEKKVTFIYKSFNRQNQAKRLFRNLKSYYPNAAVVIADDSSEPLELPGVIHLPFNSGLSKGMEATLEAVRTPFVVRLDDDMLLTPHTDIHRELDFLMRHPEVDLVAFMADHRSPKAYADRFARMRMDGKLLIPAGKIIEGRIVAYKTPNCFLARTEKVRLVGYDPNLRINEHQEFFSRAVGRIVCVLDPKAYVMHCHNQFEKADYDMYRYDTAAANRYVRNKHASAYQ